MNLTFKAVDDIHLGHYWIDPNLGSPDDAIHVYCVKPGCSCMECSQHNVSQVMLLTLL